LDICQWQGSRGPSTSSLPIYAELTEDQQAYVVETIKKFYGGN